MNVYFDKNEPLQKFNNTKLGKEIGKYIFYGYYNDCLKNTVVNSGKYAFIVINRLTSLYNKKQFNFYHLSKEKDEVVLFHLSHKNYSKICFCIAGGGYECVANDHESFPIGLEIFDQGYDVFVLNYSIKDAAKEKERVDQLALAISFVINNQKKLKIDILNYSIIGCSAGGHLVSQFLTDNNGYNTYHLPKPCVAGLIYPVISLLSETHAETRDRVVGTNATNEKKAEFSSDMHISKNCPPIYIAHSTNDSCVPISNSERFVNSLITNKVHFVYKKYNEGNHGWSVGDGFEMNGWTREFIKFWKTYC